MALVNKFELLSNSSADQRDLYLLYGQISTCLTDHFTTEENQMRAAAYDSIDDHADEHRKLLCKLVGTEALFNIASSGIERIVLDFFYSWFLEHVSTSDRKFSKFLLDRCEAPVS